MQAVAAEAGVSKPLVHYYFSARSQLVAAAYAYAEARALEHARREIADVAPGARRLEELLCLYLDDESTIREDWILWSELSNSALFDQELTPSVETAYANWIGWITSIVEQGIADGSIESDVSPVDTGRALTAFIEGVNRLLMLRLLTRETALDMSKAFLARLGIPAGEFVSQAKDEPQSRDANGTPLANQLLSIASETLRALESVAQSGELRAAAKRMQDAVARAEQLDVRSTHRSRQKRVGGARPRATDRVKGA